MKKFILIFLLSFSSLVGYSQILSEDFESAPNTADASGVWTMSSGNWLVRDNRTNSGINWQNTVAPFTANSGTKAAFVNKENVGAGVYAEEWLITPQRNILANSQLRFFTKQTIAGDSGSKYQIRVSSDPDQSNLGAFTTLIEYTETELSTLTADQLDYEEKTLNLAFTGQRYFAFVKVITQPTASSNGLDRWLVDDVKIVERCLDPVTPLGVSNITATTARLTWTSTNTEFQVEYGVAGFLLGTGTNSGTFTDNNNPRRYGATGLTPNSGIQFYVRSICPTSVSEWVGPFNFNTPPLGRTCAEPIVVTPIPYSNTSNTTIYGNNILNTSPGGSGLCGAGPGFLGGNDVVYAYTVENTGNITISLNPQGATNTGVFIYASCANIGNTCIAGVGNATANIRTIPSLAVTAGQIIYIVISSTSATATFGYTLSIQTATCPQPVAPNPITIVGSISATATWDSGTATSWEIAVQTAGSNVPSGSGIQTNNNTGYLITSTLTGAPLTTGTPYQYWVRADCGGGLFSPWSGPYLFTTSVCESIDQCNYTFTLTDTAADGWQGGRMQVIQNGLVIATLGATVPATVPVSLCNNVPFQLFWSVAGTAPDEMRIAIKNSFGQTIYALITNGQTSIGTNLYSGTVDCINPMCLKPGNPLVPAATITFNSVVVNWTNSGVPTTGWELYIVPQGSPAPNTSSVGIIVAGPLTPPTYTITTGLLPDTNYTVYIRSICSVNGPSDWSTGTNFKTKQRCFKPTAILSPTLITTTSASLRWTNGTPVSPSWEVIVLPVGSPAPIPGDIWTPAPTNPFVYTGLIPDTAYVFYVRSVCGGAEGTSSIVGPSPSFTTLPTCYKPTAPTVTANSITTTSATVTWVKGQPTDTQWQILLIPAVAGPTGPVAPLAPTANPDLSNGTLLFTTTAVSPFTATGLTLGTIYYYYVRTVCSPTDSSNWTPTAIVFNTLICDPANKCNYKFVLTNANGNSWNNGKMQVRQNGIVLATLGTTQVNGAPVSVGLCPGVPFDLFWNTAGTIPNDIGVSIQNPFLDVIYTKAPGEGTPLTILYNSVGNCTPAACSKPTGMTAVTTSNSATLSWTDASTPPASQYALYVVPSGQPAPTNIPPTTPTISPVGNPFSLTLLNGLPLTPSTSYTYYVKTLCSPGEESNWTSLTPTIFVTKPLNDECLNARPVTINTGQTCLPANTLSSTTLGATASLPILTPPLTGTGCGQANNDIWFSFVAQSQNHSINFSNLVATPATATINHSVFSGTCGNLTKLYCSAPLNSAATGLTVGETYYIRVYNAATTANQSVNFDLCITSPPANDDCIGAIDVPVNPNQECTLVTAGNTLGATPSLPAGTGTNCTTTDDDVWFKFTATNNIHIINISGIEETPSTATIAINHSLWSGACNGLVNLYCSAGPDSVATGLTIGQTYYIRAYSAGSIAGQSAIFNVCLKTPPPPATNNECATAIPLTVNPSSTCNSFTPGNIIGATASLPPPATCVGNANDDVWFSFVATAPRHFISLFDVQGTTTDLNHAVYSGTCGALTLKYCSAANSLISNNATFVVGQTYYIRVWSNSAASQVTTFNICVKSVSTCATAVPFCGSDLANPFIFENTTGIDSTGQIACLGSNPNPTYYTLHVGQTGPLEFNILQNTVIDSSGNPTGTTLDVDFVAWGPFTSAQACSQIAFVDCPTCPFDNFTPPANTFYPFGNIVDCSFSFQAVETLSIPNAQQDEYYVILITNFSDDPGFIKLVQTNFGESGSGETICCSVGLGPDKSVCDPSITLNALEDPDDVNNVPSTFDWFYNGSTTAIPNQNGPLLTVTQSGTYKVKGSCGLNPVEDEIQVTFNVTPTPVVTITQPTCLVLTGTVEVTAPVSPAGVLPANLFISEVTDEPSGATSPSLSYVEIFNGTGVTVDLSNYKLKVYTNGNVPAQCDAVLTGLIANNTTKIIKLSTDANQGGIVPQITPPLCTGVNTDDSIVLTTNADVVVDVWGISGTDFTPLNAAGYDYTRNSTAVAPSTTWNAADWTVIDWTTATAPQNYSGVGLYTPAITSGYQYNIDGGAWQTTTTFNSVAVGTHIINVKDLITSCTSSLTINVAQAFTNSPVTTFSYTTPVCINSSNIAPDTSAVGFTNGGTYTSNPNTLMINTTTGEIDVLNSPAGTYEVSYSVSANLANCLGAGSSPFNITIKPVITPNFDVIDPFCTGTSALPLDATSPNGVSGTWSPAIVSNTQSASYVFNPNVGECAISQTLNVTVLPTLTPNFLSIPTICSGTIVPTLNTISPNGIIGTWSPDVIDPLQSGTYTFIPTVSPTQQCGVEQVLQVTISSNPQFQISNGCLNGNYTLQVTSVDFDLEIATYLWKYEGNVITGQNSASIIVSQAGNYTCEVSYQGCSTTEPLNVVSVACTIQKGISPKGTGKGDELNDYFNLENLNVTKLEIFNRYGTKVYSKSNYSKEWYGQTDSGDELPDGTYFYVIERNNEKSKTGWIYINHEL